MYSPLIPRAQCAQTVTAAGAALVDKMTATQDEAPSGALDQK